MADVVVPSSEEDRKKLKLMLSEMVNQLKKISFEKETYKEISAEIKKQFDLPPKVVNKMAKTMYSQNFDDVKGEHSDFETLYEILIRGSAGQE